jgi:hypothetical protein
MGEECEVANHRLYKLELKKTPWVYMNTRSTSIFKDPNVAKHLHDKYVIVSADKVS